MTIAIERYETHLMLPFPRDVEEQGTKRTQPDVPITVETLMTNAPGPGIFRIESLQLSNLIVLEDVDAFELRYRDGGDVSVIKRFEATMRDTPITISPAHGITMIVHSTGKFREFYQNDAPFPFVLKVIGKMRTVDSISRNEGETFGDYMRRLDRFAKGIPGGEPPPIPVVGQSEWGVWMTEIDGSNGRWLLDENQRDPFGGSWEAANGLMLPRAKLYPQTIYTIRLIRPHPVTP